MNLVAFVAFCCWRGCNVRAQPLLLNRTVSFFFRAKPSSAPLAQTLPKTTQLYKSWPKPELRIDLPDSIPVVTVHDESTGDALMGPPIHIQSGDRLKLTLKNDVPYTGLSVHLHGLKFGGAFEYDGAVGVSQCPLAEGNTFIYNVVVDDSPGTYWYHTSSGHLGVEAHDVIRGPIVVHPPGSEDLVNLLNAPTPLPSGYSPLTYKNERILFLQDGFLTPAKLRYKNLVGNLAPPPSKRDDGVIAATSPWHFGTCNGKLRDVIHLTPRQKHKFRVINGGQHHALRFRIDPFPLTVVAADSKPVEAYTVDEIVLHVGERFDIEVFAYNNFPEGESFWIRADTLESRSQGFQNGIRAIMRVTDPQSIPRDEELPDPPQSIMSAKTKRGAKILNCRALSDGCIPITMLSPLSINHAEEDYIESEIHIVDTHFQPAPQYGHFVSIDSSAMTQNELPPAAMVSHTFRPKQSIHLNSMGLRVAHSSPVIIVWRTSLLMDVPIHLHGHSVEILDAAYPALDRDCNLQSCKLSRAYESEDVIKSLDKTLPNHAVEKDTFVIPAGGAIVTRMHTGDQGLWLVTGQKDIHYEDGMSFVLFIGDYQIPKVDEWPEDFPTCNSGLVKSMTLKPNCECYIDKDSSFQLEFPMKKYCSRDHLCRHEISQAANLDSYAYGGGFHIQSGWNGIPDLVMAAISFLLVATGAVLIVALHPIRLQSNRPQSSGKMLSNLGIGSRLPHGRNSRRSNIDIAVSSSLESPFMIGMSRMGSSEYIGTIELQGHSEEDEEAEEDDSVLDADTPPPPPPRGGNQAEEQTDEEESKSVSFPPHPPQRTSSQRSSGDLLLNRASTVSTFERIFSERGNDGEDSKQDLKEAFDFLLDGYSVAGKVEITPVDETIVDRNSPFGKQLLYLLPMQWNVYRPSCVNLLRFVEVTGLAFITGAVFRGAGRESTQATITELSSLLIFLTTTWTFSRLFSSIPSQHGWYTSIQVIFRHRRFSVVPVYLARISVVLLCEGMWAIVATAICFPVATLVGDLRSIGDVAILLTSNNICYLSLGSLLGTFGVPYGMIAAALFGQVSILISGIFAELPPPLAWARYASPFYWTMRGLLKSLYRRSDTYDCVNGSSSEIGANQCFIEYNPLIEQYQRRGFHLATSDTQDLVTEYAALLALSLGMQLIIFGRCFFAYYKVNWDEIYGRRISLRSHGLSPQT